MVNVLYVKLIVSTLPTVPASEGKVDIGLQTKKAELRKGKILGKNGLVFVLEVTPVDNKGNLDFRGELVHGKPGARFLYLSWKRAEGASAPWYQRVKIPLEAIDRPLVNKVNSDSEMIVADITGRKPHQTTAIEWYVE